MIVSTDLENLAPPVKVVRVLAGINAITSRRRISHHQTIPAAHNEASLVSGPGTPVSTLCETGRVGDFLC
jgi:hypothetical protein